MAAFFKVHEQKEENALEVKEHSRDVFDKLPEIIDEGDAIDGLPEIVDEGDEIDALPDVIDEGHSGEATDFNKKKVDCFTEGDEKDVNDSESYLSTYDERIRQTPKEDSDRGEWEGERGESKFIPKSQEIKDILDSYGLDGIEYKDGIPDFSEVSEATVEIDNMTENRAENFKQCDEKCAEQWNKEARDGRTDWTARDVAQWRKENGYSWHERNDMKTCDLVPTKINDYFGHLGGVSECKKRDAANNGGDFDE